MSKLVTLSDYYLQDVPEGTLFMPHNVSSLPDKFIKPGHLLNRNKWKFHDKPIEWDNAIISNTHNYLSFLGKGLKAMVQCKPDESIMQHWSNIFGDEVVPEFTSWGTEGYTIVKVPVESLPADLHWVNADILYKVQSKKFIGEIDVPQAKILGEFQPPCVVKATHGADGSRVYFVKNKDEYREALDDMNLPKSEIIITELIQDVKITNCTHFYVTKKGEVQWISAAVQYLPGERAHGQMEWILKMDDQPELKRLLFPLCKSVGLALHKEGYFGYCGIDVVIDKNGNKYVVDVNPRANGSSTLQLSTLYLHETTGYTTSSQRIYTSIRNITLDDLIRKLESVENGTALLVSALPNGNILECVIRIYSSSPDMIDGIFDEIYHWSC